MAKLDFTHSLTNQSMVLASLPDGGEGGGSLLGHVGFGLLDDLGGGLVLGLGHVEGEALGSQTGLAHGAPHLAPAQAADIDSDGVMIEAWFCRGFPLINIGAPGY